MNQLQQMLMMQAALTKAGEKIVRDAKTSGPPILTGMDPGGRVKAFTVGVGKRAGEMIAIAPKADAKPYEHLKITGPDGQPIKPATVNVNDQQRLVIPGDAAAGMYAIETKGEPVSFASEAQSFFLLRQGQA